MSLRLISSTSSSQVPDVWSFLTWELALKFGLLVLKINNISRWPQDWGLGACSNNCPFFKPHGVFSLTLPIAFAPAAGKSPAIEAWDHDQCWSTGRLLGKRQRVLQKLLSHIWASLKDLRVMRRVQYRCQCLWGLLSTCATPASQLFSSCGTSALFTPFQFLNSNLKLKWYVRSSWSSLSYTYHFTWVTLTDQILHDYHLQGSLVLQTHNR